MLPVSEKRCDPARTREKWIPRQGRSAKEQMVSAAGARLLARAELFERTEPDLMRHPFERGQPPPVIGAAGARWQVDLDDAGIRRDGNLFPGHVIARRNVPRESGNAARRQ